MIYEQQCVEIMNKNHSINVVCNSFNSSFRVRKNGTEIEQNTINNNKMHYSSCCINKTYLVRSFGDCLLFNVLFVDSVKFLEKGLCDEEDFSLWNTAYKYTDNCLYKIQYKSPCDHYDVKHPACFSFQCNMLL